MGRLILLLATLLPIFGFSQQPNAESGLVNWLTFKEALDLNAKQPKPLLIDFYTDWCGWCKHMMKTTYSTPGIAQYINTNFYPVKFDAEGRDTIEYQGVKYFNPGNEKRSTHQLALKFLGNRLSYPSTVFLSSNLQFSLLSQGYLEVRKIEPLLIYVAESAYKTTAFEDFEKYYEKVYPAEGIEASKLTPITLKPFTEVVGRSKKKKLVFISAEFCNTCKIMEKGTFSTLSPFISENFDLAQFNAFSKDTIIYSGYTFVPAVAGGPPFHQFVMSTGVNNTVSLPTILVMDENDKIIDILQNFLTAEILEPVLHFYSENAYTKMKWPEYKEMWDKERKKP